METAIDKIAQISAGRAPDHDKALYDAKVAQGHHQEVLKDALRINLAVDVFADLV
jgi:hypothetical protein